MPRTVPSCSGTRPPGPGLLDPESVGEGCGGWFAEVVALSEFPSLVAQDVGLHLGFDAFGDPGQVHALDQTAHALSEGVGLAVAFGEVVDEEQVEFDSGHRQVP